MKTLAIYIVLLLYAVAAIFTITHFDGTGDSGDSVTHYLFARYAPAHPELFFDHWAKPVYVLLASPFAQFGFAGVKVFNALAMLLTIFFTFKTAKALKMKNALVCAIVLIFAPRCFALTFSGLTELLFALFLSAGVYAVTQKKYFIACLLISFLPFVRSEGLIIIGVFALYLFVKSQWRLLPVLLTGHVVYSLAGSSVHHDLLWVFNKIPYAQLESPYGSGNLFHFVVQFYYITGAPIYILFWVGVVVVLWKAAQGRVSAEFRLPVFLGFFAFFIAHTLFWYFGLFNSMGLSRVLVSVMPLVALICLEGYNLITTALFRERKSISMVLQIGLIGYVLIFPFTKNKAALDADRDLQLSPSQQAAKQTVQALVPHIEKGQRIFYCYHYLGELLQIDPFDKTKRLELAPDFSKHTHTGDIIIWENWFAPLQNGVSKEMLDANSMLVNIYDETITDENRQVNYAVYKVQ